MSLLQLPKPVNPNSKTQFRRQTSYVTEDLGWREGHRGIWDPGWQRPLNQVSTVSCGLAELGGTKNRELLQDREKSLKCN